MNLKSFSNRELHEKVLTLSTEERRITLEVLWHLKEVEARRLYAERGHSSLFEYVTRELNYSEGSAQRRISAMRALRDLPELAEHVESGNLKVTQLAQAQSFFRSELKSGKRYTLSEKREVITETIGKSSRETEALFASINPEYAERDRIRAISENKTQITFTADEILMKDIQAIRDRFAHQIPAGASLAEVIQFMAKIVLGSTVEKKANFRQPVHENLPSLENLPALKKLPFLKNLPAQEMHSTKETSLPPAPKVRSRYIPIRVKREVWNRDQGRCTFVSPINGRKCLSRHRLQVDHIKPYFMGGASNDSKGLRLLCFAHNQLEAAKKIPNFGRLRRK